MLFVFGGACGAASAQQAPPASPPASNWITTCAVQNPERPLVCEVEHTMLVAQTNQRLLTVTLKIEADAPLPALMLRLPLGLFLPDGIELRVDDREPLRLAVQTCNADGCYAGSAVSEPMLASLMGGRNLTVTFQNLAKTPVTVRVPLAGFEAAYRKVR